MPTLTPPTPWEPGDLTSAMMNAKVNALIAELQVGTARGVLYTATSTAVAETSSVSFVDVPGIAGAISVESPRTLQIILQAVCNATGGAGGIIGIQATVGGKVSIDTAIRLEAAGGPGQVRPNLSGIAVPVPAGTANITLQVRRTNAGSSTSVDLRSGATLQVIDQGAS